MIVVALVASLARTLNLQLNIKGEISIDLKKGRDTQTSGRSTGRRLLVKIKPISQFEPFSKISVKFAWFSSWKPLFGKTDQQQVVAGFNSIQAA